MQLRAPVQQALAEGVVVRRLGAVEGLQPLGQAAPPRLAPQQPQQDLGVAPAHSAGTRSATWKPA
jgi:hypothetical protein